MAGIAAPPAHPIDLIAGLVKGRVPWPVQSTVVGRRSWPAWSLVLTVVVLVAWHEGRIQACPGR